MVHVDVSLEDYCKTFSEAVSFIILLHIQKVDGISAIT